MLLAFNNSAIAQEKKIKSVDEALGAVCGTDLQIGLQVFGIRDKGKNKEFQENAMAVFKNPREKRMMGFSINDAYLFPKLHKNTYALYRMEICYQQMTGKNIPQVLTSEMVNKLKKCQNIKTKKEQYSCIGTVANQYSK